MHKGERIIAENIILGKSDHTFVVNEEGVPELKYIHYRTAMNILEVMGCSAQDVEWLQDCKKHHILLRNAQIISNVAFGRLPGGKSCSTRLTIRTRACAPCACRRSF